MQFKGVETTKFICCWKEDCDNKCGQCTCCSSEFHSRSFCPNLARVLELRAAAAVAIAGFNRAHPPDNLHSKYPFFCKLSQYALLDSMKRAQFGNRYFEMSSNRDF